MPAAATGGSPSRVALLAALLAGATAGPVSIVMDGAPAVVGNYTFERSAGVYRNIVLGNGILEFEFAAVQNTLPSAYWTMSAVRVTHVPTGVELGNNVSGSQNDGEQHMVGGWVVGGRRRGAARRSGFEYGAGLCGLCVHPRPGTSA